MIKLLLASHLGRQIGGAVLLMAIGLGIVGFLPLLGNATSQDSAQAHSSSARRDSTPKPSPDSKPITKPVSAQSRKRILPPPPPVVTTPPAGFIGIYVDEAPGDPAALTTLDQVAGMGFNVVYNYSSIDGTISQITNYLNYAQSRGIKVIFSLKDLYDQLPIGPQMAVSYPQFGTTNESIALGVVKDFSSHPATWGFGITDEAPETPASLSAWAPTLTDRYQKIKTATSKPVMAVLLGYSADTAAARRSFLTSLKPATDDFALDYYPVPYGSIDKIAEFAADMPAVGDFNGWSVIQDFSWASYPATATGLGYDLSLARPPTTDEMVRMAQLALTNGAKNLLFYSYFDIKSDPVQQAALRAAIVKIKG